MHRTLRDALHSAEGTSHFVVAINVDIRGFSSFFSDSSQAAAFLTSAYARILDEYFRDLSFFKPTGDGLLMVRDVTRESLQGVLQETVDAALRLERDFANLTEADALINFETPERVGIGIARGTATRLRSGDLTLDYSGRPLNLASRLMDLARPRGVVFDDGFGVDLLREDQAALFRSESVYLKGIADTVALVAHLTSDVDVPPSNRRPFGADIFREEPVSVTLNEIKRSKRRFLHKLSHRPLVPDSLKVGMSFPATTSSGAKDKGVVNTLPHYDGIEFEEHFEGPYVAIDYPQLAEFLERVGVKGTWPVTFLISYPVPLRGAEGSATDSHLHRPPRTDSSPRSNVAGESGGEGTALDSPSPAPPTT